MTLARPTRGGTGPYNPPPQARPRPPITSLGSQVSRSNRRPLLQRSSVAPHWSLRLIRILGPPSLAGALQGRWKREEAWTRASRLRLRVAPPRGGGVTRLVPPSEVSKSALAHWKRFRRAGHRFWRAACRASALGSADSRRRRRCSAPRAHRAPSRHLPRLNFKMMGRPFCSPLPPSVSF